MTVTVEDVTPLAETRWHYRCDRGHQIINAPRPKDACPVVARGCPCRGTLERFGPGSRTHA